MARAQASEKRPALIIASFPCPLEPNCGTSAQRSLEDQTHLERVIIMYEDQLDRGGWKFHEHPWNAESWEPPRIETLRSRPDMYIVREPMCHWRQDVQDRPGFASEKSEACWMTNSRIIAHTHTQPRVQFHDPAITHTTESGTDVHPSRLKDRMQIQ